MTRDEFVKEVVGIVKCLNPPEGIGMRLLPLKLEVLYDELFKDGVKETDPYCGRCYHSRYLTPQHSGDESRVQCYRYPKPEIKWYGGFCGEFKAKGGK